MHIRIHSVYEDSIVDGLGIRFVVFTQGCIHQCKGCHNPETWNPKLGYNEDIHQIAQRITQNPLCSGLTLSGGEPFLQAEACTELAKLVHAQSHNGKDIWVYTGYTLSELLKMPHAIPLLDETNYLVDGPFIQELRSYTPFKGSANQTIYKKVKGDFIICDGLLYT